MTDDEIEFIVMQTCQSGMLAEHIGWVLIMVVTSDLWWLTEI